MMESKSWNSNFLDSIGIKFELHQCNRPLGPMTVHFDSCPSPKQSHSSVDLYSEPKILKYSPINMWPLMHYFIMWLSLLSRSPFVQRIKQRCVWAPWKQGESYCKFPIIQSIPCFTPSSPFSWPWEVKGREKSLKVFFGMSSSFFYLIKSVGAKQYSKDKYSFDLQ